MGVIVDFLKDYLLIWIVLAGLLLYFFVWRKLDVYTKMKISNFFTGTKLLIILFAGGWMAWRWVYPYSTATIHLSSFWMPMILGLYLVIVLEIYQLRYDTRQIITPNFHGSFAKRDEVGDFYIYPIGSVMIFDSVIFTKKVLVVRKETVQRMEWGGDISIARVAPIHKTDLDKVGYVKTFIEKTRYYPKKLSGKLYYGWFDDFGDGVDYKPEQIDQLIKEATPDKIEDYIEELKEKDQPQLLKEAVRLKKIVTRKKKNYLMLRKELGVDYPSTEALYDRYMAVCKGKSKQGEVLTSMAEDIEEGIDHDERAKKRYAPASQQSMGEEE